MNNKNKTYMKIRNISLTLHFLKLGDIKFEKQDNKNS